MPPFGLRLVRQLLYLALPVLLLRYLFFSSASSSSASTRTTPQALLASRNANKGAGIQAHGVIDRLRADRSLDVHKYPFLQSRRGRDDRPDIFDAQIALGVSDYWERFSKPWITGSETAHLDAQVVRGAIDELLSFNGWVTAACPTLSRPFGQNKRDDHYEDLVGGGHLYYIAIVVHSADHFLVDQLAVIVQLSKRLGYRNLFVSILDSDSTDSTPTLSDLCEAVLTILGLAFQIRRVPPMTLDPSAAYYPLEEATARNLALEPLFELEEKRGIRFHRVVWLKGFTCPTDVLESLRVSRANDAGLVCGMDWAEHNGFFIFSDRWRTRDIEGNLFRQAKSNARSEAGPPRDKAGTQRYSQHLPFQVFCCESGSHVVDPAQSYYKGITYRASPVAQNLSTSTTTPEWDPETQCMDSSQMWFCRDLWTDAARQGGVRGGLGGAFGGAADDDDADEDNGAGGFVRGNKKGKVVVRRHVDDFIDEAARKADDADAAAAAAAAQAKRDVDDEDEEAAIPRPFKPAAAAAAAPAVDEDAAEVAAVNEDDGDADEAAAAAAADEDDDVDEVVRPAEVDSEDEDEDARAAEDAPPAPPVVQLSEEDFDTAAEAAEADEAAAVADQEVAAADAAADDDASDDDGPAFLKQAKAPDGDQRQTGSDADAMAVEDEADDDALGAGAPSSGGSGASSGSGSTGSGAGSHGRPNEFLIPNSAFRPARIVVNPRCVTTYGGVSHAALAQDLFGTGNEWSRDGWDEDDLVERYAITEWQGPPDSFVCQEMRTTGGRVAPKSQRRVGFLLSSEVGLE